MKWRRPEFKVPLNWQWVNNFFPPLYPSRDSRQPKSQKQTMNGKTECKEKPYGSQSTSKKGVSMHRKKNAFFISFCKNRKYFYIITMNNFKIPQKWTNYLGETSAKCIGDLYSETYMTETTDKRKQRRLN